MRQWFYHDSVFLCVSIENYGSSSVKSAFINREAWKKVEPVAKTLNTFRIMMRNESMGSETKGLLDYEYSKLGSRHKLLGRNQELTWQIRTLLRTQM